MRWIPVVALAGAAMLAGCLQASSVQCANGAVCPSNLVCTENAASLCGPPEQVAACLGAGKEDYDACAFTEDATGTCREGVCLECSNDLTGCQHAKWVSMTSPVGVGLLAVWAADLGRAYAAGAQGTLLAYDGREWTASSNFPTTEFDLVSISGSGPSSIFVLASNSQVFRFDGTTWSDITPVPSVALKGLWCPEADRLVAVGPLGVVMHFDGSAWSREELGAGVALNAVWASSPAEIVAVGNNSDIAHHSEADPMWRVERPFDSPKLNAVWGAGPDETYAVGLLATNTSFATLLRRSGGTWSQVEELRDTNLFTVWGSASDDVYVGGDMGTIARHAGAGWASMVTPTNTTQIKSISGSSRTNVFAVGSNGVIWHFSGAPE